MTLLDANSNGQPEQKVDAHTHRLLEDANGQAQGTANMISAYRLGAAQAHTLDSLGTVVANAYEENKHQSQSALFALATPVVSIALKAAGKPNFALAATAAFGVVAVHEYGQLTDAHNKQAAQLRSFDGLSGDVLSSAREVDNQASAVQSVTRYGVIPALALSFVHNPAVKVASLALVTGMEGYAYLSAGSGKSSLSRPTNTASRKTVQQHLDDTNSRSSRLNLGGGFQSEFFDHQFAHGKLLTFAGDRHGEFIDDFDVARNLKVRNSFFQPFGDVFRRDFRALFEHHPEQPLLRPVAVGKTKDLRLGDSRITMHDLFNFSRINIFSAADDHVFLATGNM